jgi:hypothetical protein
MSSEASVGGHSHAPASTARPDNWWVEPLLYFCGLSAFLIYATWRAVFAGHWWFVGAENGFGGYVSPFFSPPVFIKDPGMFGHAPLHHAWFGEWPAWLSGIIPSFVVASPGLLILPFPGMFRFTCYYYRKAYYRSFVGSPPACAVTPLAAGKKAYKGETALLVFQNLHRYTMYFAVIFIGILAYDAVQGFFRGGQFGVGVGSLVLLVNVCLLGGFTFGCNSVRHLIGGRKDCFSCDGKASAQFQLWKKVTFLNERHMQFAWFSLFWVGFTDFYVWMVSAGHIRDLSTWSN